MYVKPERCIWKIREVSFLRVVLRPYRIKIGKEKVQGVLKWPTFKGVKDVQRFLGCTNYYRRFVRNFAKIAKLLYIMVKKISMEERTTGDIWEFEEKVYRGANIDNS